MSSKEKDPHFRRLNELFNSKQRQTEREKAKRQPSKLIPPPLPRTDLTEDQVAEAMKEIEEQRWKYHIGECIALRNLPAEYRKIDIADAKLLPDEAKQGYQRVAKSLLRMLELKSSVIGLIGPRGNGKTHLAAGLINEFVKQGKPARYTKFTQMLIDIRETWRPDSHRTTTQAINTFVAPILLVIDEGQERSFTDNEQIWITDIVDRRYAEGRNTLLISNQNEEAFAANVGESVVSRIRHRGGLIQTDWMDLREIL